MPKDKGIDLSWRHLGHPWSRSWSGSSSTNARTSSGSAGVEVSQMYDNDSRGNRLLERARLSQADQRLILVDSRHSLGFEEISESMHMQYPEFRAAPPVCGRDGLLRRTRRQGIPRQSAAPPGL